MIFPLQPGGIETVVSPPEIGSSGRSLGLELSGKGADLAGKVRLVIDAHEQALLDRIPAEHQAHLLPVLLALWGDQDAD